MPNPAVILFIKAPRPGAAKTRLTPFLTGEQAAQLARCLARDTVGLAHRCLPSDGGLIVAYAPDDGWPEIESAVQTLHVPLIPIGQTGADLGSRMANAVRAAAGHDCGPFVLLGADCPHMPPDAVQSAFSALTDGADVVCGPAEDGGYYLLGLRTPDRLDALFADVVWSREAVLRQTVANADRLGMRVTTDLPVCYDIDTPADLVRLQGDMAASAALRQRAPSVAGWLSENPLPALTSSDGGERP